MRITLFLSTVFVLFFLSSCEKAPVVQTEVQVEETWPDYQNTYNSDNMTAVPWDQLPESIRNAEFTGDGLTTGEIETDNRSDCYKHQFTTPAHGSHGGGVFLMKPESSCDRIHAIVVRASNSIKAVMMVYQRENGSYYVPAYAGGNGGVWFVYQFEEGEIITAYGTRYTNTVNFLRLGTYSTIDQVNLNLFELGQQNGTPSFYNWTPNRQVLGFYGEDGDRVNRLGALVYETDEDF